MSNYKKPFTDLVDSNGKPKIAPVQGYVQGIPWSLHLEAYDAYCKKWSRQEALIDLEGRGCRGGFSTGELDSFIPGWRDRVSEITALRAALNDAQGKLRRITVAVTGSRSVSFDEVIHCIDHLVEIDTDLFCKAYIEQQAKTEVQA